MACKKILIVDDDPAIRATLSTLLEIEGFDVITAGNGEEGIAALRRCHDPCVIFLDMMMPVMNGWQFLDEQRGDPALADIPTVIISAYGEIAKSVRPAQYLAKPLQLDSVLDTIKRYCQAV